MTKHYEINGTELGIITQLQKGKDGFARSVTIRKENKNHITRSIEKLYPIEVLVSRNGVQLKNRKRTKRRTSQEQDDHHKLLHKSIVQELKNTLNNRLIL